MSSIFVEIEEGAEKVLDFIKKEAGEVKQFIVELPAKASLFLQQHEELVTKTLNIISGLVSKAQTGAQKMDDLLTQIRDGAEKLLHAGGFSELLAKGVDIVRSYAQDIYNLFKAGLQKVAAGAA